MILLNNFCTLGNSTVAKKKVLVFFVCFIHKPIGCFRTQFIIGTIAKMNITVLIDKCI